LKTKDYIFTIWEADVLPLNYSRILFAINNMQTTSTMPARRCFRECQPGSHPRGRLTNQPRSYHTGTCLQRKAKVPLLLQPLQPAVRFAPGLHVEEA
jgi:hypothetical protein